MSTLLKYAFLPNAVFVNSKDSLKLVVENPASGKAIHFKSGRGADSISIKFPVGDANTDLAKNLDFSVGTVTTSFSCSNVDGVFVITATRNVTLAAGEFIEVTFKNISVNSTPGTAQVHIWENIGSSSGATSVEVTKKTPELGVIVWLDPLVVGLGQSSTLQFKSAASTHVVIAGYPDGTKTFDTPPYTASDEVVIGSDTNAQRTYTATAWAGGNQSTPESATLTQVPPLITSVSPSGEQSVGPGEKVRLTWTSRYGSSSELKWLQTQQRNPLSPFETTPGTELTKIYTMANNKAQWMPDTVTYTIIVHGFQKSASQDFVFRVKPVQLVYLKYKQPDFTEIAFAVDPATWSACEPSFSTNALKITIYQPGPATDIFYLSTTDTTNPMIQYFEVVDGNLSWITANLKSLTLNPGNILIEDGAIKKGIHAIPADATSVILTGAGTNGKSVRSVLDIPQGGTKNEYDTEQA